MPPRRRPDRSSPWLAALAALLQLVEQATARVVGALAGDPALLRDLVDGLALEASLEHGALERSFREGGSSFFLDRVPLLQHLTPRSGRRGARPRRRRLLA